MEATVTTYNDAASLVDQSVILKWEKKYPAEVVTAIQDLKVSAIYKLHPDQIVDISETGRNPLDGISKRDDLFPKDLHPVWPMVYFFDLMSEQNSKPPTWEEYWHEMKSKYLYMLEEGQKIDHLTKDQIERAWHWRFGVAWQSWYKELYTISVLRHICDVGVQKHTLADVHLKIDMWYNNKAVCLTMKNEFLGQKARPPIPWKYLLSAREGVGNGVWYPTFLQINEVAQWLRE